MGKAEVTVRQLYFYQHNQLTYPAVVAEWSKASVLQIQETIMP